MIKKTALVLAVLTLLIAIFIYTNFFTAASLPGFNPERHYISDRQEEIQSLFLLAKDGDTIQLPAGHFTLEHSLILENVKDITIRGHGIDQTVLNFRGQKSGAEGLRIGNAQNITLENFGVENAIGDNIKITDSSQVTVRNVRVAWTGQVSNKNGAYALYPVLCSDLVIDNVEAIGSADAGIYVGQSDKVIVRNSKAFYNVAGIEIENSTNVHVHDNQAFENTAGILVFDLPGLTRFTHAVKVFRNRSYNNNIPNFAPKGTIVAMAPPGVGFIQLASSDVELYQNEFADNRTAHVILSSYQLIYEMGQQETAEHSHPDTVGSGNGVGSISLFNRNYQDALKNGYQSYPKGSAIYKNSYSNTLSSRPYAMNQWGKLVALQNGGKNADILWDGSKIEGFHLSDGQVNPEFGICINEEEGTSYLNMDVLNDFRNVSKNIHDLSCS